ncbi:MAG TPA: ATP-binding cassette domain-containing protein [Bacteroidetes bacterium]|nr:ATP-binding cassette domain-containing protein [Bacteroidota bacterium]
MAIGTFSNHNWGFFMLHIDILQKSFGHHLILDVQNLSFPAGVHFIIGPNGAGKTTFLKCLAGIHPFKGEVSLLEAIDLQRDHVAHRRAINFSEAEPIFPRYLRGQELLDLVLAAKGGTMAQAKAFKDAVGINYLDQKVGTYSSGMKKKLALLLAFLGKPKLILLDEPFAAVDQASRLVLTRLIQAAANEGISFFISSHLRDLHAAFGEGQVHLLEEKSFREVREVEVEKWLVQDLEMGNIEVAQ